MVRAAINGVQETAAATADGPLWHLTPGCARLLQRVFDIDLEHRAQCGGELKIIAAIEEPAVIVRILTHLESKGPGSIILVRNGNY